MISGNVDSVAVPSDTRPASFEAVDSAFGEGQGDDDHDDGSDDQQDLVPSALVGDERDLRWHGAGSYALLRLNITRSTVT